MENPDQNDSDEIARSPDEARRSLEEIEASLIRHERIINDFKIIGATMSGDVDEGFAYDSDLEQEISE